MEEQISLIDETYNPHNTEQYKITIQVLPGSLTCTLFDDIRKKHVLLRHFVNQGSQNDYGEIISQIDEAGLLKESYCYSRIYIFTEKVLIIPSAFFSEEKAGKISGCYTGEGSNEINLHCLSPFNTVLSYNINKVLYDFLSAGKHVSIFPYAFSVLNAAYRNSVTKQKFTGMLLNILNGYIQVAVLKLGSLMLFNTFSYSSPDDLSYYIVYLFGLFELDKERDAVIISGIIEKNDERIRNLESFLRAIQFSRLETRYIYSYRFNEFPQHWFSNLFISFDEDNRRTT